MLPSLSLSASAQIIQARDKDGTSLQSSTWDDRMHPLKHFEDEILLRLRHSTHDGADMRELPDPIHSLQSLLRMHILSLARSTEHVWFLPRRELENTVDTLEEHLWTTVFQGLSSRLKDNLTAWEKVPHQDQELPLRDTLTLIHLHFYLMVSDWRKAHAKEETSSLLHFPLFNEAV